MRLLSSLFLLMICLGCKKETHPKIEIYLLKHPVESTEGIPYVDSEEYKQDNNKSYDPIWLETARYDTVYKRTLWGGDFSAGKEDLENNPFIKDDEILNFDSQKDIIVFDSNVVKRIEKIGRRKAQFVITIDKKPMLCGYFWTAMISSYPQSFYIYDYDAYDLKEKNGNEKSYMIEFENAKFREIPSDKKRPPYNPKLIEALRSTGRLIE